MKKTFQIDSSGFWLLGQVFNICVQSLVSFVLSGFLAMLQGPRYPACPNPLISTGIVIQKSLRKNRHGGQRWCVNNLLKLDLQNHDVTCEFAQHGKTQNLIITIDSNSKSKIPDTIQSTLPSFDSFYCTSHKCILHRQKCNSL